MESDQDWLTSFWMETISIFQNCKQTCHCFGERCPLFLKTLHYTDILAQVIQKKWLWVSLLAWNAEMSEPHQNCFPSLFWTSFYSSWNNMVFSTCNSQHFRKMVICLCLTVWGKGPWVTSSKDMLREFDNLEKYVVEQKKNAVEQKCM